MCELLEGKDLRSISNVNQLVDQIKTQKAFDKLFCYLFDKDRLIVMRSVDAIEKITISHPEFLASNKKRSF